MDTAPLDVAADAFARELTRWRAQRGFSQKKLASMMGFDPSYISHIEGRRHRPTQDFARRAETALGAGGAIWARFREYDELRRPVGAGPLGTPRTISALAPFDRDGRGGSVVEPWAARGTGLIVDDEYALLSYHLPADEVGKPSRASRDGAGRTGEAGRARKAIGDADSGAVGEYRCTVRRWLYNGGHEPVIRYPVQILVDRYPGQTVRPSRQHPEHPLPLAELDLRAFRGLVVRGAAAGDGTGAGRSSSAAGRGAAAGNGEVSSAANGGEASGTPGNGVAGGSPGSGVMVSAEAGGPSNGEAGEPMAWRASHDLGAFKEIWLLFENDQARFPLYPGQRAMIEYSYRVSETNWGTWFQRSVRLPTRRLSIRLDFPAALHPIVWGVQSSLAVEAVPLRTPPLQSSDGDRTSFEWHTDNPSLWTRYRLEWRFRGGSRSGNGR